jgi:hypothetical protein
MTAASRRSASRSASAVLAPSHSTSPAVGTYSAPSSFASVVLREPFSPTSATISPGSIASETPSSAGRSLPG